MAAALTAARRGHRTHLIERDVALGGQLALAHKPPHREELKNALDYFRRSVAAEAIDLHLGREWSVPEILALEPDHVVLAIGATTRKPAFSGIENANVAFGWEIISEQKAPGRKNVVIGGGLVGIEVADFLASLGHEVIVVARSRLLSKAVWADRVYFIDRIAELGIEVITDTEVEEIGTDWISLRSGIKQRTLHGVDTIIVCAGYEPQERRR